MRLLRHTTPGPLGPRTAGRARLIALLSTAAVLLVAGPAAAGGAAASGGHGGPGHGSSVGVAANGLRELAAVKPVMTCADATTIRVTDDNGDPVTFTSAKQVTSGTQHACELTGTIAPASTVVIRLPLAGWSQRYLQTGCGGLCGSATINVAQAAGCTLVQDGSLALATTDMGHQGQNDGSWAANDPQAVIDFSDRSVHATALVAKKVLTKFYGRAPVYSYFDGCSDGGREALMEAQRYPHDFDGIAAGAPANDMAVQNTVHHAWNVLTNVAADGSYILLADKLPLVHQAVLAKCDAIDGITDGLLQDPTLCHFDPRTLVCTAGQDPSTCLTAAEAGVVQRLHDGATDGKGNRLDTPIAHEWGSELQWTLFVPSAQGQHVASEMFALSYLQYLADPNHPDPSYQLSDFAFTVANFWKSVQASGYQAALDPDLGAFQRSGGKLLLWHGWEDQHISPQSTLEYYDAMKRSMGTRTVESFAKLYLFPGVAHCGGGDGPNAFDVLTPVMAWVESGSTPNRIVASAAAPDGSVTMTRPVYPYPKLVRYDGSGSTNDASNFVPYTPRPHAQDFHWVGAPLYSSSYQQRARAVGDTLVLTPRTTWLTRLG